MADLVRKTAACPDCGRPFEKPDRSTLRRSLRRHLVHNHGEEEKDARDLAMELVPGAPARPRLDRDVRTVQSRRRKPRAA